MIRKGDMVRIRAEYRGASEPDIDYLAADDEQFSRVDISPVEWKWRIIPRETLPVKMLVVIESCAS